MDVGVVAIKGLNSNYYLAISRKGEVYGSVSIQVRGPDTEIVLDSSAVIRVLSLYLLL